MCSTEQFYIHILKRKISAGPHGRVGYLPSKHEALRSNPSPTKKEKKKKFSLEDLCLKTSLITQTHIQDT
jgi:hypothetical protein